MKNGTQKTTTVKKARAKLKLPPKPVFVAQHRRENGLLTTEDAAAYGEYLTQLRDWLYALPDKEFDRESRNLSDTDRFCLGWKISYDAHHNGNHQHETA